MTILSYTLKRLVRNKISLGAILILPALMIGLLFGFTENPYGQLAVGLVDEDATPLTDMLTMYLEEHFTVKGIEEGDIRFLLANGSIMYALVIDSGFTEKILTNQNPIIRGYSITETNLSRPIGHRVESFFRAAQNIAAVTTDPEIFYQGMEAYSTGLVSVYLKSYSTVEKNLDGVSHSMGFLAMSMLFFSAITAIHLVEERKNRTFFRVLAAPISLRSYTFQKILSFFLLLLAMALIAMLSIRFLFGIYLGPSPFNLFLVMAVFALLCVSLSIAIGALTRTLQQVSTVTTLTIIPLSMLGGLLWPREIMPEILQTIGQFLPTTWLMKATETVILGQPLFHAITDLTILGGFALVFFILGNWHQQDITS